MSEKWKIIIIGKLVGISEAIRLILIYLLLKVNIYYSYYLFFTLISVFKYTILKIYLFNNNNKIKHYYFIIIEPTLNDYSFSENNTLKSNYISDSFFEWLAGVIDGDDYFRLSKQGTARLTITMDLRDKNALYEIKHKLGGFYLYYCKC